MTDDTAVVPLLKLCGVTKTFPDYQKSPERRNSGYVKALDDVSVDVYQGDSLVLIGPSGSGKSTLLRTMNLLSVPDRGRIEYSGDLVVEQNREPVTSTSLAEADLRNAGMSDEEILNYRRHFGFVFQNLNLWPTMTLRDNIAAPLRWGATNNRGSVDDTVMEWASFVRIDNILDKFPDECSGGERQRAAIARALVSSPEILLLDEITSALDPVLVAELLALLLELRNRGQTMVTVTHHLGFARRIANKVLFLDCGAVVQMATAQEVLCHSKQPIVVRFVSQIQDTV